MSSSSEADTINALATDPVPRMVAPLSTEIQLLRGIAQKKDDGSTVWHDVAHVNEITGEDEEALSALTSKGKDLTYTEYMNALLEKAVVLIGDLKVSEYPGIMNKLILADRDMLFLGVVRATYGVKREIRVGCPSCRETNDVEIDLDEDFAISKPDFDVREPISVETKKGIIKLRLPNGEDTIFSQKKAKTDAELNTAMLARCAVWEDGEGPPDPLEWARKLNVADRRKLVNTLLDIKLGPDLGAVDTQCAHCGKDLPIQLDWVNLLFG